MDRTRRPEGRTNGREGRSVESDGYRWTCPLCGLSRLNPSGEENGEENAVTALRAHVLASVGDGHGPRSELPPEVDERRLTDHVVRVDGRDR